MTRGKTSHGMMERELGDQEMRIGAPGNAKIENLRETKIRPPAPAPQIGTVQIFPSKYNGEDYLPNSAQTQILPLSDEAKLCPSQIFDDPCLSY